MAVMEEESSSPSSSSSWPRPNSKLPSSASHHSYYLAKTVLRSSIVLQLVRGHIRSPFSNDVVLGKVAKENADVVIMDDNFATIVTVAKWGRSVYFNIQKRKRRERKEGEEAPSQEKQDESSAPLTAVQLLWVNMIMDTLGALALATEPPHDGLMRKPPIGAMLTSLQRLCGGT